VLVDRKLEHLRIDENQAHVAQLGFIEQRQNHRVERHRFARAGGAGHQEVRHAGEVRDHRVSRDVLAEREGERRVQRVIGLGTQDLGQAHHLPVRIGNLQPHAGLAGNGLDHADRDHRQGAGQVLHQVDDLAALDADGRLDLVAGDHRAGVGGDHLDRNAEIRQFFLDQPRRELQRFRRHLLAAGPRLVEQLQRRQGRIRKVFEQRRLLLLLHPLGLPDLRKRQLDAQRRMLVLALLLGADDKLALLARAHAQLAVAPPVPGTYREAITRFEHGADDLGNRNPGNPGEQAEADGSERQQHERGAGEAQGGAGQRADAVSDQAARRQRQLYRQAVEPKPLKRRAGDQQNRESGQGEDQRTTVDEARAVEAPVAPDDDVHAERDPPVSRQTEQVERDVRNQCPDHAARVARDAAGGAVRPARIAAVKGGEDQQQVAGDGDEDQPLGFAQQARELCGKGCA